MKITLASVLLSLAMPLQADPLPSGLDAELLESLVERQPNGDSWLVLRVLAPGLAHADLLAEQVAADTDAACERWGVVEAANLTPAPAQIVLQIMSADVPRGSSSPDIAQIFAGYRYENGLCIWEDF